MGLSWGLLAYQVHLLIHLGSRQLELYIPMANMSLTAKVKFSLLQLRYTFDSCGSILLAPLLIPSYAAPGFDLPGRLEISVDSALKPRCTTRKHYSTAAYSRNIRRALSFRYSRHRSATAQGLYTGLSFLIESSFLDPYTESLILSTQFAIPLSGGRSETTHAVIAS